MLVHVHVPGVALYPHRYKTRQAGRKGCLGMLGKARRWESSCSWYFYIYMYMSEGRGRGSGCMWGVDAAMADSSTVKECCICGDVGFDHALLHCLSCGFRFQHTYCSGSYPKIDMATWRCEWCIHEESKLKRGNNAFDFLLEIAKSLPDGGGGGEEDEEEDGHPAAANDNNGNNEEKKSQRRRREEEKPQRPKAKRQKSLDRWRRPNCNSSSSPRVIGRRYKLLADVLC